jgi:hypothetical protein
VRKNANFLLFAELFVFFNISVDLERFASAPKRGVDPARLAAAEMRLPTTCRNLLVPQ